MKKILILLAIASIGLISCKKNQKVVDKEDNFLNVPTYDDKTYTPIYKEMQSSNIPTYWYIRFDEVICDAKTKEYTTYDWHLAIMLNTPYFDFMEAKKVLPTEIVGDCYFNNFIQINKESYESFVKYKENYFK